MWRKLACVLSLSKYQHHSKMIQLSTQYCLHTFDFTSAPNAALYMASSQRSPIKSEGIWPPAPGQRPALLTTTSVASLLASQEDRALPRGHLGWDDGHLQVAVCFAQLFWSSFKGSSRSRPLMVGSPSILAGGTLSTMWQAPTLSMGFYLWKGKSTTMYLSIGWKVSILFLAVMIRSDRFLVLICKVDLTPRHMQIFAHQLDVIFS